MVNHSKATLLFAIGYVIAIGLSVILSPLQATLRGIIVFGAVQLVFTELHLYYLSRTNPGRTASLSEVLKVGSYWAVLSLVLDVVLFGALIPGVFSGTFNIRFLETQPFWYWLQFPMMLVTGLVARSTYLKVNQIKMAAIAKEEAVM